LRCVTAAVAPALDDRVGRRFDEDERRRSDVVTALGGLLFVPAAILFAGIGLTGGAERRDSEATEPP